MSAAVSLRRDPPHPASTGLAGDEGPLEKQAWPTKLTARVVSPGARPTLHGYDVEDDLARNYTFAETILLALTGQPPGEDAGRAFEVAMTFASTVTIAEAPVHAALVARACAASPSQLLGVTALGLAEQTRVLVDEHRAFLDALSGRLPAGESAGELAARHRASSEEERASVDRLCGAVAPFLLVPSLSRDLSRPAAVLAVLHACGLRTAEQIELALAWARMPVALAEALAVSPGSHLQYPVNLPSIVYEETTP